MEREIKFIDKWREYEQDELKDYCLDLNVLKRIIFYADISLIFIDEEIKFSYLWYGTFVTRSKV